MSTTDALHPAAAGIVLPAPQVPSATLEHALENRRSSRSFDPRPLSLELLSALLWSAFGVNRRATRGRTAPSAHNWQETDVYVVTAIGVYRYDAQVHALDALIARDLRAATGLQEFVGSAPLDLVYVADFARMPEASVRDRAFLAGADAGCIAQNVYLFCAAAGLATVLRGLIDRRALATALRLAPTQRITLAQTVGHPARP